MESIGQFIILQKKRIENSIQHKIYIEDYNIEKDKIQIQMIGTTKNNYKIIFYQNKQPFCNCIDCRVKQNICKHIIYCLFKIGKIDIKNIQFENIEIQKQLTLATKIQISFVYDQILKNIDLRNKNNFILTQKMQQLNLDENALKHQDQNSILLFHILDEDCPVCYCSMNKQQIISCPQCKNHCHQECLQIWLKKNSIKSCPYCRFIYQKEYNFLF